MGYQRGGNMDLLGLGKGKIVLTFYDIYAGTIIKDLIQVEVRRDFKLVDTKIVKDGKLILNDVPFTKNGLLGIVASNFYSYWFGITSGKYKGKVIQFDCDRHTRDLNLDIALEPKKIHDNTVAY